MFEVPIADQVPLALVEVSMDSRQDAGKGKEAEALQGKDKGRTKRKILPNLLRRPQTLLSLSPSKLLIQELPRDKLRILVFVVYSFFMFIVFVSSFC